MAQQKAWTKEYTEVKGVPTTTRGSVSSSVINLLKYAEENNIELGKKVLDLGSGIGRNAIYLAEQGFTVTALDFIEEALNELDRKAAEKGLADKIKMVRSSLSEALPFADNSFDWAMDIVSSVSLSLKEMKLYESEVRRVVKSGGYYLTYAHSRDDEYLAERADENGFYEVPESGLIEHSWTEEELEELYSEWEFVKVRKKEKLDTFYDKKYMRRMWWILMRNKNEK